MNGVGVIVAHGHFFYIRRDICASASERRCYTDTELSKKQMINICPAFRPALIDGRAPAAENGAKGSGKVVDGPATARDTRRAMCPNDE